MAEQTGSGASLADFIWKNAEDLWGNFKHTDFGKLILPFTLLRRLECVLEPTRKEVCEAHESFKDSGIDLDLILRQRTRYPFYNTSEYALGNLGSTKTRQNLLDYVAHFSDNARVIFEQFDFSNTVIRLDKAGVLFKICKNFAGIDLHPEVVSDRVMSNLYEHLIRRFGAEVNEGAEDFMTPRDVVHLATALLLDPDDALFESNPGLIRTLYDPTCGTGGFLTDAMNHVADYGNRFKVPPVLVPHGQELEPETHAVCLTGMLLRTLESDPGRDLSKNIRLGSTLSNDQFANDRFHYCLSNPPFGKKWENDQEAVNNEHKEKKYDGRFGPGLPRINDGSMLFLMHLASKLELPEHGGGRAAIVLSGSPLFNGGASSGESEIRRWLLENDLVEAIVALPTEIFFRTGIGTYLWILSNKKSGHRQNQVQLINATALSKNSEEVVRQELATLRDGQMTPDMVFRDPYLLNFLGLSGAYSEKDLEAAILREMESFLLEMGNGFCFVERQKRMSVGKDDFYLDLLFYHRHLRRLVAVELKLESFQPSHKGQMELYLRWLDKHERATGEEPPIGLILCASADAEQIELLQLDEASIRVAEYLVELPPVAVLRERLHRAIEHARERTALPAPEGGEA